jgi:hypothetical protein
MVEAIDAAVVGITISEPDPGKDPVARVKGIKRQMFLE